VGTYTDEPVDHLPPKFGRNGKENLGATDWEAVAAEYRQHPNKWLRLKLERYTRCSNSNAKYAIKKLREQSLQADKREHYRERPPVANTDADEWIPVRDPLGVYSVWGMWIEPTKQQELRD
jgi:hypothetical protein